MSTWMTKRPATPGYYWYRFSPGEERIVHVMDNGERLVACGFEGSEAIQYMDGQWSGPLTPPEA